MADLPASIGWLTVQGHLILGYADSSDAGSAPDAVGANGAVTFTANIRGNDPLVSLPDKIMVAPVAPKATLTDGYVYAPADGSESDPAVGAVPGISLIAPQQSSLSVTDWTWTATFTPASGQKWRSFSRVFTGKPGDVVDLAELVATTPAAGVAQMLIYEVATTDPPYPTGFRPGTDWLLTPDGKIWSVV